MRATAGSQRLTPSAPGRALAVPAGTDLLYVAAAAVLAVVLSHIPVLDVVVYPWDVSLALAEHADSALNLIAGDVLSVARIGNRVRVRLEAMTAEVTARSRAVPTITPLTTCCTLPLAFSRTRKSLGPRKVMLVG